MGRQTPSLLLFQDLSINDEWQSQGRTITVVDVVNFAGLTGDFNPIHIDHETAAQTPFGQPVAHGLLGLVLSSGLAIHDPRVDTITLLAILDWKFLQPIAFGDTIHTVTRVANLEPRSNGRRGLVTWDRQLLNQHGVVVQQGRFQTLVRGKMKSQNQTSAEPNPTNQS